MRKQNQIPWIYGIALIYYLQFLVGVTNDSKAMSHAKIFAVQNEEFILWILDEFHVDYKDEYLLTAIERDHVRVVERYVAMRPVVRQLGHDLLNFVIRKKNLGLFKEVITLSGVKPPRSLLSQIIIHSATEIFDFFLDKTDVNIRSGNNSNTPLIDAVRYGRDYFFKRLLAHPKINLNIENGSGSTAFDAALQSSNTEALKLLANKKNINRRGKTGMTPLMDAVLKSNEMCIACLLERGADPNAFDMNGETALIKGLAYSVRIEKIEVLVSHPKTDLNLSNIKLETPLIVAIKEMSVGGFNLLVECPKVDPNKRDNTGMTALMYAAINSDDRYIKALLANERVDFAIKNRQGKTALDLARDAGLMRRFE